MTSSASPDPCFIRPEVRIFFRDIKEHPDDDTPRLIFADWLQEHGDEAAAARGEFLRLQVLRHRLAPDDPNFGLLKRREGQLFKQQGWRWLGSLPDLVKEWSFERGLVQIKTQAEKLLAPEMEMMVRGELGLWIDSLTIRGLAIQHMPQLAVSPLLPHLNMLDLSSNRLRGGLRPLFRSANLHRLRRLVLSRNPLRTQGIQALVRCLHLMQLAVLELEGNQLDDAAALLLAGSSHLKNLKKIRIRRNRLTANGIALLRQAFGDRVEF